MFAAALKQAFEQGTATLASIGLRRAAAKSDRLMEFFLGARDEKYSKDGQRDAGGGLITMTLAQLDAFLQRKQEEERLLAKTIQGTAVDVTPETES